MFSLYWAFWSEPENPGRGSAPSEDGHAIHTASVRGVCTCNYTPALLRTTHWRCTVVVPGEMDLQCMTEHGRLVDLIQSCRFWEASRYWKTVEQVSAFWISLEMQTRHEPVSPCMASQEAAAQKIYTLQENLLALGITKYLIIHLCSKCIESEECILNSNTFSCAILLTLLRSH